LATPNIFPEVKRKMNEKLKHEAKHALPVLNLIQKKQH
jgi:hypothetical protein